ncbi:hypothetical protein MKW94_021265 [Papaver nudicaule]|uniref:Agenet domain-containing protein n=1 Tax=Papaver nudicaule TaxID=74823 RepID=A0AA41VUP5_PAPNU|nr:hypothetical protein [Papaver nudicaule]
MGFFSVGDAVEVIGHEDGFWGSYYEATIIKQQTEQEEEVLIEYKTLVDDDKVLIQEPMNVRFLRPAPPEIEVSKFKINDEVDVLANDGWWVGRVTQVFPYRHRFTGSDRTRCNVWFDSTQEEIDYQQKKLRVHQDWDSNGNWVEKEKHDTGTRKRRFEDDGSSVLQQGSKKIHSEGVSVCTTSLMVEIF